MKIMFIASGMTFGGAERVTSILSNKWIEFGHEVIIVLTETDAVTSYTLNNKVKIISIWKHIKNINHPHFHIVARLKKIIDKECPDCVLSFYLDICALSAFALIGKKIPLIYSERNDPNRTNQRVIDKIYRKIVEKEADGFVFQTDGAKSCYKNSVQMNSVVILNPLDANKLPHRECLEIKKEIVSVGRLVPQKRQDVLLKAYMLVSKQFPEYKLLIYGSGELEKQLNNQIQENKISGAYLKGNSINVLDKIKDSALFVLSSDYEGIPNALLEAMAIGIPSISTDCTPGGARMLIEDSVNGFIVPCGDENVLAERIIQVLSNQELSKSFSEKSKLIRKKIDPDVIARQWIRYIEKIKEVI